MGSPLPVALVFRSQVSRPPLGEADMLQPVETEAAGVIDDGAHQIPLRNNGATADAGALRHVSAAAVGNSGHRRWGRHCLGHPLWGVLKLRLAVAARALREQAPHLALQLAGFIKGQIGGISQTLFVFVIHSLQRAIASLLQALRHVGIQARERVFRCPSRRRRTRSRSRRSHTGWRGLDRSRNWSADC